MYDWPIWRKEASRFAWTYQQQETCYILRGRFTVTPDGGESQHFQRGDLITFPQGMQCTWEITEDVENTTTFSKRLLPAGQTGRVWADGSSHRSGVRAGAVWH